MEHKHMLILILIPASSCISILLMIHYFCRKRLAKDASMDTESNLDSKEIIDEREDLIKFNGGEDLTVFDILDAPGEVIGKCSNGSLYRASFQRNDCDMLLRFLRPACSGMMKELVPVIELLGSVRHPNLVPLFAFYGGPRGEKLLVHPFYDHGTLAQFIRDGNGESHKWTVIYRIASGIAKGLDYLHTGLQKPLIHGNLKSKNILLGPNCEPYVSGFGLHLLLNPTAAQEMLEDSAAEGYKAPELIKMKDTSEQTDIYSLGLILLELITGKKPINEKLTNDQDFYLPNSLTNAILDYPSSNLYHPDILIRENLDQNPVKEEGILKFLQLAMACCSPSPSLRPDIKQIITKLEEIGD